MMAKMIIIMDPPEHRQMRSLVNKVFTPRAIEALRPMVTETIDRYLAQNRVRPVRRGAGLLRLLPGAGDHPDAGRAGGVPPDRSANGWTSPCTANPVRSTCPRRACRPSRSRWGSTTTSFSSAAPSHSDDMFSRLDRRRDRTRRRREAVARRLRDRRLRNAFGRRGRRDGHQADRQRGGDVRAHSPTSGRSCSTTAARSRPRSRSCCATRRRTSTTCAAR